MISGLGFSSPCWVSQSWLHYDAWEGTGLCDYDERMLSPQTTWFRHPPHPQQWSLTR